jgi:hypothetical protein
MRLKSWLAKPLARRVRRSISAWAADGAKAQDNQFRYLVHHLALTAFGKAHGIRQNISRDDFRKQIPIADYEVLRPWIERIIAGERDVLWPGRPKYFAKTSGTTSGVKFIPITSASMPHHISGARNALLCYIAETEKADFVGGKLIFLSGSPVLHKEGDILTGRLSGIVNHHIPGYLRRSQMPSYKTNCIEDWEEKVNRIADETLDQQMTLISGIPPWVQMYFDKVIEKKGAATVKEVFPDFNLFVYGGVNFEPYRKKLFDTIGERIDSIETYPASEGFIAFQDRQSDPSLLMLLNSGIYYEFVPVSEYHQPNPPRFSIEEVELGVNYAVIMHTNAGLWGYSIGDTVRFVSKNPYKILVTGRIKHFISAFGEHVIGEEVERAMSAVCAEFGVSTAEFTVAPIVAPSEGLPYHEWLIEFDRPPADLLAFSVSLDAAMQQQNVYYQDLISGAVLQPLKVRELPPGAFIDYMRSIGKLGGQNKVPRLSNDREIAKQLLAACGLEG